MPKNPSFCVPYLREHYQESTTPAQHRAITKLARKTNHVERISCTVRQRVSRRVHAMLSFSKKLSHYSGAIRSFICDYNLIKCAALPGEHYPGLGLWICQSISNCLGGSIAVETAQGGGTTFTVMFCRTQEST